MIDVKAISAVLFLSKSDRVAVRSLEDLRVRVTAGLPKSSLKWTAECIAGEEGAMRLAYEVVPRTTYKRRRRLSAHEGAATARLARVFATALHVLEDKEAAREYMFSSHPVLGDERPIDLALSEIGAIQVENALWRVFYGVTA